MGEKQLRRIPVVDAEGRLAGIISLNDLALATNGNAGKSATPVLSLEDLTQTLTSISRHRPSEGSSEPN